MQTENLIQINDLWKVHCITNPITKTFGNKVYELEIKVNLLQETFNTIPTQFCGGILNSGGQWFEIIEGDIKFSIDTICLLQEDQMGLLHLIKKIHQVIVRLTDPSEYSKQSCINCPESEETLLVFQHQKDNIYIDSLRQNKSVNIKATDCIEILSKVKKHILGEISQFYPIDFQSLQSTW